MTTEPLEVERLLRTMHDDLVERALQEGSSVLVSHLQASIAKYGEPRLTPVSLQLIERVAGAWAAAAPAADHPVGRWFRPLVAARLADEGIATLGQLVALCNARGGSWWRSVPRIGAGRARVLVAWLRRHARRGDRRRRRPDRAAGGAGPGDRAGPRPTGAARAARDSASAVRRAGREPRAGLRLHRSAARSRGRARAAAVDGRRGAAHR